MARLRNQDNSGPVVLKHIGMFDRKKTCAGQKFTTSICSMAKQPALKVAGQTGRLQKGQIKHAVMLTMRGSTHRHSGITVQFGKNTAAMVDLTNGKNVPLGDRIVGPIAMEVVRQRLWQKLVDIQDPKCIR
eukprot:TRINITY_DN6803_c0_g1_i1.p4 TRINITY_DN6803_c0_g1~~TRINITY_DN6803_c0_g1_i1.p4  ORF type:complete len:151 (-),score=62.21 TRINITY_DN6803_c0_g1_i1:42-434(-)